VHHPPDPNDDNTKASPPPKNKVRDTTIADKPEISSLQEEIDAKKRKISSAADPNTVELDKAKLDLALLTSSHQRELTEAATREKRLVARLGAVEAEVDGSRHHIEESSIDILELHEEIEALKKRDTKAALARRGNKGPTGGEGVCINCATVKRQAWEEATTTIDELRSRHDRSMLQL
jgi:hypothetical protein